MASFLLRSCFFSTIRSLASSDKRIRQKSKKSELLHCWQCLLSGASEPLPHGLRKTIAWIHTSQAPRWHGMAWHGMAWHGMAWHGMAWHGMAWHGMAPAKAPAKIGRSPTLSDPPFQRIFVFIRPPMRTG